MALHVQFIEAWSDLRNYVQNSFNDMNVAGAEPEICLCVSGHVSFCSLSSLRDWLWTLCMLLLYFSLSIFRWHVTIHGMSAWHHLFWKVHVMEWYQALCATPKQKLKELFPREISMNEEAIKEAGGCNLLTSAYFIWFLWSYQTTLLNYNFTVFSIGFQVSCRFFSLSVFLSRIHVDACISDQ